MTENKVTGKAYRILTDKANEIYDRVSFWTHATDVEMENGKNLQEELSSTIDTINGTMTNKISALKRTLNSTITNRLSPLETQVNTNKNGIATLNTNLGNLSNTVNSNYTTLNNGLSTLRNTVTSNYNTLNSNFSNYQLKTWTKLASAKNSNPTLQTSFTLNVNASNCSEIYVYAALNSSAYNIERHYPLDAIGSMRYDYTYAAYHEDFCLTGSIGGSDTYFEVPFLRGRVGLPLGTINKSNFSVELTVFDYGYFTYFKGNASTKYFDMLSGNNYVCVLGRWPIIQNSSSSG